MRIWYIFLLVFSPIILPGQSWELKKEIDGIKAYHQTVPGSKFKRFRLVLELKGSLESIVAILQDIDAYPNIFPDQKEARLVDIRSDTLLDVFIHTKTPFPAKDRFSYTSTIFSFDQENSTVQVDINCIRNTYALENNKGILISDCSGFWKIQDLGEGRLKVIHEFHADPGGAAPGWIVNKITINSPIKSVQAIRKLLLADKYQNRSFSFIN